MIPRATILITVNFVAEGDNFEDLNLDYSVTEKENGKVILTGTKRVEIPRDGTVLESLKIPFTSPGAYSISLNITSSEGKSLGTSTLEIHIPWLSVNAYVPVLISVFAAVALSIHKLWKTHRAGQSKA